MTGVSVIQAPVDPTGSFCVLNVPWVPGTTMFVTDAPGAPKAKPNCCGALDGIVMFTVYDVPLPVATQVSPVATTPAPLPAADPRSAASASATNALPPTLLMIACLL